jgi:hypothetical protein
MTLQKTAELISGTLTAATIVLCFMVVYHWRTAATNIILSRQKWTAEHWFIMGVTIGFAGELLDNFYWFWPWTFKLMDHPAHIDLMHFGVFANIPFRQVLGSVAAFCHIRSAYLYHERHDSNKVLAWAITVAITYLLIVLMVMP